jgi:hypothetical protein
MKVPTYKKYGISKRKLDSVNSRTRKVSNLLTHDIPLILGITIGIALWIFTYRKLSPSGFLDSVSKVFLFSTIGLICVGIPMLLFKAAEKLYYIYLERNSASYIGVKKYEDDREKFDYWKIRRDENYWRLLDGLSFEKEMMNVLFKLGYSAKSEIKENETGKAYVITKNGEDALLLCNTSKAIEGYSSMETLLKEQSEKFSKILLVSSNPFPPGFEKRTKGYQVDLISLKELVEMVRTIKE